MTKQKTLDFPEQGNVKTLPGRFHIDCNYMIYEQN